MLSRRGFGACAICSAIGLTASGVGAQTPNAQTAGLTRTVVNQTELPGGTQVVIQVIVDVPPHSDVERHTHPGIEGGYVLEGEAQLFIEGREPIELKPGVAFQVPQGVPHSAKNGARPSKIFATLTVEKGKPIASPA